MGHLLIAGDINSDLLKPKIYPGRNLIKSLKLAGCSVHSSEPTRITPLSKSQIDIVAVPAPLLCDNYIVGPMAGSDHSQLNVSVSLPVNRSVMPNYKRSFHKLNFTEFMLRASEINLDPLGSVIPLTSDTSLDVWEASMLTILDDMAPVLPRPHRRKRITYLTPKVYELMNHRNFLEAKYSRNPSDVAIWTQLKMLTKRIKSNIRHLSKSYGQKLLNDGNNIRDAWKFIRNATFTSKNLGGSSPINPVILNEFFGKLVMTSSTEPLVAPDIVDCESSFNFATVSVRVVENALRGLKINSATGPDGLPASLLRRTAAALAPNITKIINLSLTTNTFPTSWKKANVTPIWKSKGSKSDPGNYRPISVTSIVARLFERLCAKLCLGVCYSSNNSDTAIRV